MAKIKVTKMNFTSKLKSSLGGDLLKMLDVDASKLPDESEIWINTDYITVIHEPLECGEGAFTVEISGRDSTLAVKNIDYEKLVEAWQKQ